MCLSRDKSGPCSSSNNSSSTIAPTRPESTRITESSPTREENSTERFLRSPSPASPMESSNSKLNQNGTPTSPSRDRYSDRAPPDYNRRSSSPPSSLSARSPPPHLSHSHIPGLSSHHSSLATTLNSSMLGILPSALQAGMAQAAQAAAAQGLSSPRTSPPTLVPSAMSMASMASMLGHPGAHNAFLHPSYGRNVSDFGNPRDVDFASNMSKFMDRSFGDSPPPPTVPTNDPMANECKIVDYRGEKVAAFVIQNRTMLCLPQVFELFLKHLVGGLHTVYTKLKRLEITPIVCNVEQVRILRGLGAIQPGVNRCKLLADSDFDALYKDCTTTSSRPGRPPKRGVPFPPMSPQDAMLHLKNSMHVNGSPGGGPLGGPGTPSDPYKDAPYAKEPRLDKSSFGNGFGPPPPGLNPMAAQFMALNHPAAFNAQAAQQAAQAAHAAFLSQTGAIPHFPGLPAASSSPTLLPGGRNSSAEAAAAAQLMKNPGLTSLEALQRSGLLGAAYFERMREGQKNLQEAQDQERRKRESSHDSITKDDRTDSPVLNLSKPTNDTSELSGSEGGRYADDDVMSGDDDIISGDEVRRLTGFPSKDAHHKDTANNNNKTELGRSRQYSGSLTSDKAKRDSDASSAALTSGLLAGFPNLLANRGKEGSNGDAKDAQLNNVYGLIGNIQALLKAAVDNTNAKDEKDKGDIKIHDTNSKDIVNRDTPPAVKEKKIISEDNAHKEIDELRRNTQIYFKRFKKEKRYRRKLQEQLEQETKRRVQMEEALRVTSADTLKRITESLAKEMEHQKRIRNEQDDTGSGSGAGENAPKDLDDRDNTPDIVSLEEKRSSGGSGTGGALDDEAFDRQSSPASVSSSNKQYNASSGGTNNRGSESGTTNSDVTPDRPLGSSSGSSGVPSRDTPTLGFAKNLFPFNGSSLFTSAN